MTLWIAYEKYVERTFSYRIIENFRLGRDLWQSLVQPPAQVSLNFCVAQGIFCSWHFKIPKDGDWALSQDCTTDWKVVFFMSQLEFHLLQLLSVVSCSLTVYNLEKSGYLLYHFSFGNGKLLPYPPAAFCLQAEQAQLLSFSCVMCSWPSWWPQLSLLWSDNKHLKLLTIFPLFPCSLGTRQSNGLLPSYEMWVLKEEWWFFYPSMWAFFFVFL